jgi:hypothetical protein
MDDKDIKKANSNLSKFQLRLPLVLYPWAGGLLSGLTCSVIKIVGEVVQIQGLLGSLTNPLFWGSIVLLIFNSIF